MSTEVKPICVVYVPETISSSRSDAWESCRVLMNQMDKDKPDYHWLVFVDPAAERVELKVFHPKDFTDIQYEELKLIMTDTIEKIKL